MRLRPPASIASFEEVAQVWTNSPDRRIFFERSDTMTNASIRHRTSRADFTGSTPAASVQIECGEIFGVIGFSGTGKSALLELIDMLDGRGGDRGRVYHQHVERAADVELRVAHRSISVISQPLNLLHERSVLANVSLPLEVAGVSSPRARARAAECLDWVGLGNQSRARPAQLSAGERRLLAVARALAPEPEVLLCDDLTAALDPRSAKRILSILQTLNRDLGITILVATRSLDVVREICHAVAVMDGGVIAERIRLADLYAAPRTQLGRHLFAPPAPPMTRRDCAVELDCV
jgi:D-methionine transport system ATP-binding protein